MPPSPDFPVSRPLHLLLLAAIALVVTAPPAATAATVGPDPTPALLDGRGPFTVTRALVPDRSTPGFGTATIYRPVAPAGTRFGGVTVVPGFLGPEASIAWLGPRLASHGFVVITIGTRNPTDTPPLRAIQALRALDYLTTESSAASVVDPARLALVGHSAGGGAGFEAAARRPTLKAIVGVTPAQPSTDWRRVRTPALMIAGTKDWFAPPSIFAFPAYRGIPSTVPKMYAATKIDHFAPLAPNRIIGALTIAWLKRFVDEDLRYQSLLCPQLLGGDRMIAGTRSTCGSAF